jgi:hypothetical protein
VSQWTFRIGVHAAAQRSFHPYRSSVIDAQLGIFFQWKVMNHSAIKQSLGRALRAQ